MKKTLLIAAAALAFGLAVAVMAPLDSDAAKKDGRTWTVFSNSVQIGDNVDFASGLVDTLLVGGHTTIDSAATVGLTLDVTGAATVGGALAITGATTLDGNNGMAAGPGITGGTGSLYKNSVVQVGDIIKTTIFIDLTGDSSSTTDLDIIGVEVASGDTSAIIGQITAALNGTIFFGQITCLETPAGGIDDIDFYSATERTGIFNGAVTDLAETAMLTKGAGWTAAATHVIMSGLPAADKYMYMTGGAAGTAAVYTAGQFLVEMWGY